MKRARARGGVNFFFFESRAAGAAETRAREHREFSRRSVAELPLPALRRAGGLVRAVPAAARRRLRRMPGGGLARFRALVKQ